MDTAHWPQGIGVVKSMEDSSSSRAAAGGAVIERRARPQKDQALNCPRCNSTTTKFCYYNNYSLSQPRYFCKTCRRYWTEGGSLRNVPVGGGSRKNHKRSNSSSPSTSSAPNKKLAHGHGGAHDHILTLTPQNPKIHFQGQDLNLAYPQSDQDYDNTNTSEMPFSIDNKISYHHHQNPSSSSSSHHQFSSAMELLKTGMASRGLASFVPMAMGDSNNNNLAMFSSGFGIQELIKAPSGGLSFSLDHHGFESNTDGYLQGNENTHNARLLFPTDHHQDLKQHIPSSTITTTTATQFDDHRNGGGGEGDSGGGGGGGGYWNGMLGGGSW